MDTFPGHTSFLEPGNEAILTCALSGNVTAYMHLQYLTHEWFTYLLESYFYYLFKGGYQSIFMQDLSNHGLLDNLCC